MNTDIEQRDSFVFYRDWYSAIRKRSDKVRLEVYDAIMDKVFNGNSNELSELASIVMDFVMPQIERDYSKWLDIKAKRKESGSMGGRPRKANESNENQKKQMVFEEANGLQEKQTKTNESNNVNVDVNVKNNVIIEEKDSKEKEIEMFVERMYKLYPTKCPMRNTYLGKCSKDKDRIRKLLKTLSMEDIEKVFKKEIEEKYGKHYMQNLSTFLNNFPDPQSLFGDSQQNKDNSNPYPQGYWQ